MIGKTRQAPAKIEEIYDREVGKARGILRRPVSDGIFRHSRRAPAPDVAFWVTHYWMISWDLTGCEPYIGESVPHPNVHMVFGEGDARIFGVQTHKFTRKLEGRSQVFGVKFRPGGFRAFVDHPVSKLADGETPAVSVFGKDVETFEATVLSSIDEDEKVNAANAFFQARLPKATKHVDLADHLVGRIFSDPGIKTVDDLVNETGIGKRSLQRIFNEYVGVSPKWVIRRYRLHELIEKLNTGDQLDWAQLALDLGYFDQAHLINDFRQLIGYSPTQFQKMASR